MMTDAVLKSKVETILGNLPLDGQEELADYLDFLADKYQIQPKKNIVALEGIWESAPLDVTDEDVRKLREDASHQLLKKLDDGLSS